MESVLPCLELGPGREASPVVLKPRGVEPPLVRPWPGKRGLTSFWTHREPRAQRTDPRFLTQEDAEGPLCKRSDGATSLANPGTPSCSRMWPCRPPTSRPWLTPSPDIPAGPHWPTSAASTAPGILGHSIQRDLHTLNSTRTVWHRPLAITRPAPPGQLLVAAV